MKSCRQLLLNPAGWPSIIRIDEGINEVRQTGEAAWEGVGLGAVLPPVSANLMAGLIETVAAAPYNGRNDMPEIARSLHLHGDEPFPVAEVLQHFGFADVREGDVYLKQAARVLADYGTQERKMLFAEHLLKNVPLAAPIRNVLNERPGSRAPRVRFEQELEDFLPDEGAEQTLDAVIAWGRCGEVFSYNDQTEIFSLLMSKLDCVHRNGASAMCVLI